jgi:hypothetical protein
LAKGRESSESCAARLRNLKQTGGIAARNYVAGGDAACILRLQIVLRTICWILATRLTPLRMTERGLTPLRKNDKVVSVTHWILGLRPRQYDSLK